ncbi:MAG: NADH-quinone oxidoreductase subunit C [Actinobacteria bacterium]|nr:NADH-quinone oxidoreductase subunit C [Actinomycetota bacterium]
MTDEQTAVSDREAPTDAPAPELHGCPLTVSHTQDVLHVTRERLREVVKALGKDGYIQCLDSAGVDYLGYGADRGLPPGVEAQRFEVVVTLMNHEARKRIRLRVQIPESDPTCPSLSTIHPGTEAMERETFDMFGIAFDDHPDMTRVLMPEDWEGHPLRKDYSIGRVPVQFKGAPVRDVRQ